MSRPPSASIVSWAFALQNYANCNTSIHGSLLIMFDVHCTKVLMRHIVKICSYVIRRRSNSLSNSSIKKVHFAVICCERRIKYIGQCGIRADYSSHDLVNGSQCTLLKPISILDCIMYVKKSNKNFVYHYVHYLVILYIL